MAESAKAAFLVDDPEDEITHGDPDEGLQRIGCIFGGLRDEYARRSKFYVEDWLCGIKNWQVALSATSFMFFATMLPTVALGVSATVETKGRLGLCEYLISNSITGVLHAIVGTQPMLIINPTGPITAITGMIGNLADNSEINFYILYSITGLFIGFWLLIIAAFELSRFVRYMTRFTHEIFACFVCSIMVYQGTDLLLANFQNDTYGKALFDALCACTTFSLALHLRNGYEWKAFPGQVNRFFADYNLLLPVIFITAISYLPEYFQEGTEPQRLELFETFAPNCRVAATMNGMQVCAPDSTVAGQPREWFIWNYWSEAENIPLTIFYAFIISIPISAFFYVDQNISSLLCQVPEMGLEAGHYFEGSMLCIGAFIATMPLIGCPMVTGSLPQSPQFVRALTDPNTKRVCESRLAALVCHALIAVPLFFPYSLEIIPQSAMAGLLMFSGLEGIVLTSIFTRVLLTFAPTENLPSDLQHCRMKTFTFLQLALLLGCWTIHSSPFGLGVAVLIVALVPIRLLILPKCFTEAELLILDDPDAGSSVRTKVVYEKRLRGASEANLKWIGEVRDQQMGRGFSNSSLDRSRGGSQALAKRGTGVGSQPATARV